jgi:hypothetical protein
MKGAARRGEARRGALLSIAMSIAHQVTWCCIRELGISSGGGQQEMEVIVCIVISAWTAWAHERGGDSWAGRLRSWAPKRRDTQE